jgi:hypothetical protein
MMQWGIKSLHSIMQRGVTEISPLNFAAESQISPLYDAAGIQVNDCCRNLPLHNAVGSQIFLLHFLAGRKLSAASSSWELNLVCCILHRESNLTAA